MKHYPYFVYDLVLLLFFILIIPVVSMVLDLMPFAIASPIVFVILFVSSIGKIKDFRESVKDVKGLTWESKFLSLGTLIFNYKRQKIEYHSFVKERRNRIISVIYCISMKGKGKDFQIINHGDELFGEFVTSGDKKSVNSIKKLVSGFNAKYRIESITRANGVLEILVNLRFRDEKPGPEKLNEMTGFLSELLEFSVNLKKKLK